jgi:Ca2+-binding EF-hand superfamily protein
MLRAPSLPARRIDVAWPLAPLRAGGHFFPSKETAMKSVLPLSLLALAACSPASAQQHDGSRMIAQLEKADTNHDGAVSREEFTGFRATQFERIDRNNDGHMTDSDIPAFAKNRIPEEMSIETLKTNFDVNKDGKISKPEFVNGPALMFDRVDTNKDNIVTKAELETARALLEARQ